MTNTTTPTGILRKIHVIQSTLEVQKSGWDERNEYAYFKADDVAASVKQLMNEHGVIHRTTITNLIDGSHVDKQGRERSRHTVEGTVTFIDVEDGSEFPTDVIATGSDIGGDKSTRKVQVQLFKIAAVDVFMITEETAKFDGDKYEEAPADTAPVEKKKEPTVKEYNDIVRKLQADESNTIQGADIGKIGAEIAKKLGVGEKSNVWRKDIRVMKELSEKLQKRADDEAKAAANGGVVE